MYPSRAQDTSQPSTSAQWLASAHLPAQLRWLYAGLAALLSGSLALAYAHLHSRQQSRAVDTQHMAVAVEQGVVAQRLVAQGLELVFNPQFFESV